MHPSTDLTLVMGAGGAIGRAVVDRLLDAGVPVRASSRRPTAVDLPRPVEVVAADLTDPDGLPAAFAGVDQVFLFAVLPGVDRVVAALRTAGVRRVVLLSSGSVIHPASVGNPIAEEHRQVEAAFAAAAELDLVPIRPLVLASNALGWSHAVRAARRVPLYRPEARTAPIHERDVAAVAAQGLLGLDDVSGILTGPATLTQRDQVDAIGTAIGVPVEVEERTREAAAEGFARFMPAEEAEAILRFLDDAARGHSGATDEVERILGRSPLPFSTWAEDHAPDFR